MRRHTRLIVLVACALCASAATGSDTLQRAEALFVAGALPQSAEAYRSALAEKSSLDRRGHLRCLHQLARIQRLMGHPREALDYELAYGRLVGDDLPPDLQHQHVLDVSRDRIAVADFAAARRDLDALLDGDSREPKPYLRCRALGLRALVEERLSGNADSREWWRRLESSCRELIGVTAIPREQRLFLLRWVVLANEATGRSVDAETVVRGLTDGFMPQPEDWRGLHEELATLSLLRADPKSAEAHCRKALPSRETTAPRLGTVRLRYLLASILESDGRLDEARAEWARAAVGYARIVAALDAKRADGPLLVGTLDELEFVYRKLDRAREAMETARRLHELRCRTLDEGHPLRLASATRYAATLAIMQRFGEARPLLEEAVRGWRAGGDEHRLELANALNNHGAVLRATGDFAAADGAFREAVAIREELLESTDPDLSTAMNNLASVQVARGRYFDAVKLYERALGIARRSGAAGFDLQAVSLLNLAAAYRSQGQFDRAEENLRGCLDLVRDREGARSPRTAAALVALARLDRDRGQYDEARGHAERVLDVVDEAAPNRSVLAAAAHDILADCLRRSGEFDAAARQLESALDILERSESRASLSRALNKLGVLHFQRNDLASAESSFRRALALRESVDLRPLDEYSALCNLALVLHRRGRIADALPRLEEAVKLAESTRVGTTGAERERAEFFGRFSDAFDALVAWNLAAGRLDAAFSIVERSRNRAYLDQMELGGVDLRQTLTDEDADEFVPQERRLAEEIAQLRHDARAAEDVAAARTINERLSVLQAEYSRVWTRIRERSVLYRRFLEREVATPGLAEARATLREGELLLVYHLGRDRGFLFVVSADDPRVHVMALRLPGEVSGFASSTTIVVDEPTRGLVGTTSTLKAGEVTGAAGDPFTRGLAERMVSDYVGEVYARRREFAAERAIIGRVKTTKAGDPKDESRPRSSFTPTNLADTLLPPSVRQLIADLAPRRIVIVPDGALDRLPFETLVLESGSRPAYVLDRFPPIVYAPSTTILGRWRSHDDAKPSERLRLLSVGNPTYPQGSVIAERLGVGLQPLPSTETECRNVFRAFRDAGASVESLLASDAHEDAFRAAVRGCDVVHVAAHGLLDPDHGNLFGALALAPSTTGGDGFLTYGEILALPLSDCELAVLSACETSVGGERGREAGASLAQAFLAAGARRVVASHWKVSDASTAELMTHFCRAVARADSDSRDVADLLQRARIRVRSRPEWSAPYYWGAFTLVGTPDDFPAPTKTERVP